MPVDDFSKMMQNEDVFITELEFSEDLHQTAYFEIIQQLSKDDNIVKIMPTYIVSGQKLGVSNNFYVKLFKEEDRNKLFELAEKYSIQILGYNEFMPLWFTLSCNRECSLNVIEVANSFYETNLFESAEPELLYHNLLASNDQYFSNQWGLKNTGQHCNPSNIDIRAESAWNITTGSPNIRVAVFDHGFEMDHPDLERNVYGSGYDAQTGRKLAQVRGPHGTPCAGIIGAQQNNSIGISGVAPNCNLMSISIDLSWGNTPQQLANGFNWARKNGADVISNSWGGYAPSSIIENAIDSALIYGRNGLGCILVFCTQNWESSVAYPASLPQVIGVGAISPKGERKSPFSCDGEDWWGSNYGTMLDVVAPGVVIPTTDRQGNNGYNYDTSDTDDPAYSDYSDRDYTKKFNGTSAACPHVAGVAALVLSVNPTLTVQQVRDIIESTAQKINQYNSSTNPSGYTYSTTPGRPNGTWNEEMGYGLVDAYAAVSAAIPVITGSPIVCTTSTYTLNATATSWAVTGAFSISASNTTSATVRAQVLNGQNGTLTAVVNGVNVIKTIEACSATISGTSTVCDISTYTLSGATATSWTVTGSFSISASNTTSATVTTQVLNGQSGTLTAVVNGVIVTKTIEACSATISGSSTLCPTEIYTLNNASADSWTVTPGGSFSISASNTTSATIKALTLNGQSGTLTAWVHGVAVNKVFTTCKPVISGSFYISNDCDGDFHISGLPSNVTNDVWKVTDDTKVEIIDDKGISGCTLTRKSFPVSPPDVFGILPTDYYPYGETELIFEFQSGGNPYSVSQAIDFGITPQITAVKTMYTHQLAPYNSGTYTLDKSTMYYFSAEPEWPYFAMGDIFCWIADLRGSHPPVASIYLGSNTMNNPALFTVAGTYDLSLAAIDGCGMSDKTYTTLIVPGSNGYLMYPNPVTTSLTIKSLDSGCVSPNYVDIMIYDTGSNLVDQHLHQDICYPLSIDVTNLLTYGNIYAVSILQGGNVLHVQLILKL